MAKLSELRSVVIEILDEAKKKKKKGQDKTKVSPAVGSFGSYADALNFAAPLGDLNLYKAQGGVNWGPHTSHGAAVEPEEKNEGALRTFVSSVIAEHLHEGSAWDLVEMVGEYSASRKVDAKNIWEQALRSLPRK